MIFSVKMQINLKSAKKICIYKEKNKWIFGKLQKNTDYFLNFRKKSVRKIKYSVETNRNIVPYVKKLQNHTDFF